MGCSYKLIAIDVDGTILNSRHELPERNRLALHRAHEAGMAICLCTGRSLTESEHVLTDLDLPLDAGVFAFGSIVSALPGGETIARSALSRGLAERLVEYFSSRGYPVLILYDRSVTGFDYHLLRGERNMAAYEQFSKLTPARIERIDRWRPEGLEPVRIGIIDQTAAIDAAVEQLAAAFPPVEMKFNPIYAPNYGVHVIECFAPQVNKWYGITHVMRSLNIEASQVVAVGDDVNDIEMIQYAGLGVAMGNAREQIRKLARRVTLTNDQGGVGALVEDLLAGRCEPNLDRPERKAV